MADKDIVAELQQKLLDHTAQIEKILTTLKMLKEYDDSIDIPDINSLIDLDDKENTHKGDKSIKPDEFYQMSNTDAAEKYLKKVGHAVTLEEIFEALKRGGVKFSTNGKISLNVQLTRGTRKFAKMTHGGNVHFGLLEWYPKKRKSVQGATETKNDEAAEGLEDL